MSFHDAEGLRSMAQAHLLLRVSHELARLGREAAELQGVVSDILSAPASAHLRIRELQGLDRLTQEIDELAALAAEAAKGTDLAQRFDTEALRAGMKLQDLADALFGPRGPHHGTQSAPGDVALF